MRTQKNKVEIATLPNGLKVVCRQMRGALVDYAGVVVRVGSRDDAADSPGMAHFVEHTIFKGTEKRSSWHIINRMERVGGELNAYTSKEETVVYTAAPSGNLSRSLELIADLIINSRFPDSELDKEREVVADEINSYLDAPADAVFDDFEELIFPNPQLGHNILGNTQALSTFDSAKCREYLAKWYTAPNMTLFYYGAMASERVMALAAKYFSCLSDADPRRGVAEQQPIVALRPFDVEKKIDTHQAHTVMGALVGGMHSPERYPLALLTNVLGGPGMNSLLNVALREKHGYVYSVEASTTWLTDSGLFTIYFGCDPEDTQKCRALVLDQIQRVADGALSPYKLAQAKKQYLGQLAVASDNRESLAISAGRAAMYFDHVLSPEEVRERVEGVTTEKIQQAAASILQLSTLTFR